MAESHHYQQEETTNPAAATRLAALRQLAQQHLREIGQQEERERLEDRHVHAVLQEEAMRRRSSRTRTSPSLPPVARQPTSTSVSDEKGGRMRTAQDILDRIRWDPSYDVADFVVGYLDRFGGTKEIRAAEWLNEVTEEDWVPQHRIRYFKRRRVAPAAAAAAADEDDEVVWHRFDRVDRVFGSTS